MYSNKGMQRIFRFPYNLPCPIKRRSLSSEKNFFSSQDTLIFESKPTVAIQWVMTMSTILLVECFTWLKVTYQK